MSITRATLTFVMEWDDEEVDFMEDNDPRPLLLEILADQSDEDLYDLIEVNGPNA